MSANKINHTYPTSKKAGIWSVNFLPQFDEQSGRWGWAQLVLEHH